MKRKKNTFFVQPLLLNARRRHRVWKTISIVETYNTTERWLDWRRQHETLWLFDNREKRTLFFRIVVELLPRLHRACVCYVWWKKYSLCAMPPFEVLSLHWKSLKLTIYTHIFVENWLEAISSECTIKFKVQNYHRTHIDNFTTRPKCQAAAKSQIIHKRSFADSRKTHKIAQRLDEGPILWCDSCIFFHT